MSLGERDLRIALRCVSELLDTRRLHGHPVPQWLKDAADRLTILAQAESEQRRPVHKSRSGHRPSVGKRQFPQDPISAREAATIIGITRRHLLRLAPEIDGHFLGGRWLFDRAEVEEFARNRKASA